MLVGTTVCPRDEKNLPPLPQVEKNIHYLARLFSDPDIVGLPPESIIPILDREEASAILTEIATAANQATDTLIVYYAGHGLYGDQNSPLYLAAKNTTSAHRSFSAVRITDVKTAMRTSRARKRVLVLDCCYSGRALDGGMSAVEDDVRNAIDIAGTYGIAAVPGDYKAVAPLGEPLTKFTQTLVDVLEHGISSGTQVLTLENIFGAVKQRIVQSGDMQPPEASNWNDGGSFKFAKNRYLEHSGLERVYAGLEGLRQTVTLTGARLEALESRMAGTERLEARVTAIERIGNRSPDSIVSAMTRRFRDPTVWERLELPKDVWDKIPALPYKRRIRWYLEGRRNAWITLTIIGIITAIVYYMLLTIQETPVNSIVGMFFLGITILLGIIVILLSLGLTSERYDLAKPRVSELPTDVIYQLDHNERLDRALSAKIGSLLIIFPIDRYLAIVILCLCGVFLGIPLTLAVGWQQHLQHLKP